MKKLFKFFKTNWIFIILPILPLIEGLYSEPLNQVKVSGDSTPFLQAFLIIIILFTRKLYNAPLLIITYFLLLFNILFLSEENIFSFAVVFTLAFVIVLSFKSFKDLYSKLKIFTLSYSIISILIYFSRLV
ncbi:hypothetical protein N9J47_02470, partial [Flavobacteriaceae bacterium]|nr:hypothetical protein [Flavobacteriaceae bacterium]